MPDPFSALTTRATRPSLNGPPTVEQFLAAVAKLPPARPMLAEVRYNPGHDPCFLDQLRRQVGSCTPEASPGLLGVRIIADERTLPGFAELYDQRGRLMDTIRLT